MTAPVVHSLREQIREHIVEGDRQRALAAG